MPNRRTTGGVTGVLKKRKVQIVDRLLKGGKKENSIGYHDKVEDGFSF